MKQPDPMRRPIPLDDADQRRRHLTAARFVAPVALATVMISGCGRSAPVDALGETGGDPDVAGVSVTSPDTVISTSPVVEGDTTTTSVTAAPQQEQVLYTVQPGDTLSVIATSYGVSMDELAAFNGISDVNSLRPGQELAVPPQPQEPSEAAEADPTEGQ